MFREDGENRVYLAYGSNLNMEQMAWRCPYATVIGPVMVRNYELQFRGRLLSAVATIEPKAGESVPALLWEITPRCEEALDRFEGWPHVYRKEILTVQFQGRVVDAVAYIMNRGALGLPSKTYLSTILAGYRAAGFDPAPLLAAAGSSLSDACDAEDFEQLSIWRHGVSHTGGK